SSWIPRRRWTKRAFYAGRAMPGRSASKSAKERGHDRNAGSDQIESRISAQTRRARKMRCAVLARRTHEQRVGKLVDIDRRTTRLRVGQLAHSLAHRFCIENSDRRAAIGTRRVAREIDRRAA